MLAGTAVTLAGCATTPVALSAVSDETFPGLEPLLDARAGRDGLIIRLPSRGCGAKADIVFRVDREAGQTVVAFARRRLETCKGPLGSADFAFGYGELGLRPGERIVIANPIGRRAPSPSA